ncbi:MAG: universal stress protein [Bacteroidota bacterium]|nr:universal stress protein [Bacteroidota bacterium]MDP4215868.1 universal stress protein [Bacteroidota bacterium]MDP4254140.1 universal stress protein [Bacteroidota bacterium]MDP4258397.1 universal stress protein [Bacteroidota bacterium]
MEKFFNNILVPFALWENAENTFQKAIDLANQMQCHVHLLLFVKGHAATEGHGVALLKNELQQLYQSRLDPSLSLIVCIREGQPEKLILEYYRKSQIDLILLARTANSMRGTGRPSFPVKVNRLLKKVKCSVLNIIPEPGAKNLRNIVLPVGDFLPMRKLLLATYLAKLSHSTIHLVSSGGKGTTKPGEEMGSLQKSYRLLRENTNLSVECGSMPEENLADAAWAYAKKIKADLILIGPGRESLLSGWLNTLRSRWLFNVSKIPVMTVS